MDNCTILAPKLLVLFIIMQSTHFYLRKSLFWTRQTISSAEKCKIFMREVRSVTIMKILKTARPWPRSRSRVSAESHCDLSVTGVLHHSFFGIKIRSLPDLTISWSKNSIFSDKVWIAFKKDSVNFWSIILCLWLRINNPSKFCMSQLYIVSSK